MSLANLYDALERGMLRAAGKAFKTPAGHLIGWGVTVPTDAVAGGYAPGALFVHVDGTAGTTNYINEGSITSNLFKRQEAGNLILLDDETFTLGTGSDIVSTFNGTKLTTLPGTDAILWEIGDGTTDLEIKWFSGNAARYVLFDHHATTPLFKLVGVGLLSDSPLNMTMGNAAGAVAMRFGATQAEGLEIRVVDEDLVLAGAVAAVDLTADIPAGATLLSVQVNLETEITAATATKVGIGIASDPDLYGKTSALTKNLKVDTVPDWAAGGSAIDMQVYAVDNAGVAAGTINAGTIRVRIVYAICNSLDDAA